MTSGVEWDEDLVGEFVAGFDYPMFVVTAVDPATGARAGCLVGFATQTSIEPFRFLVCLSRRNHTYRVAGSAPVLAVHVLGREGEDQRELASLFGEETGDEIDKFARCDWRPGPGGVPLLTASPRRLVGRVLERLDLGDHVGFLLAPVGLRIDSAADPIGFAALPDLDAGHPAG
ncbi:NADH-FMN oxidoreductase RutF, flavin reductase (DIM6/NTAB) family [Thermomonospora echinospora]|uniref:NADH-FMN oxidoreductase RutF, flavin reductase (DIM6/NTAB) family n=1 Tax=Thermomonospora echinospora TaxID=1992 RepID=A0A1H6C3Q1_9ACTN|nr:flavin reductase family protein [Thermomonospora echinospora]SEG67255.1 NADH-FMN oxidoreductase RutF, flavin reductase (DIM6/NTAB) family [Thermomonospora echinospora]